MNMAAQTPSFHAVILAAGRGSRMQGLTESQPKCLTRLAGKPLLEWQLAALREAGAVHCRVMTGYLGHMLRGDFEADAYPRWAETNMVGTLAWAMRKPPLSDCIISYSDIVYKADHVRNLAQCPEDIAIAYDERWLDLWRLRFDDPLADAETFSHQNGLLRSIGKRATSTDAIEGQYMGLIKIRPKGWDRIAEYLSGQPAGIVDKLDMTSMLSSLLEQGTPVGVAAVDGGWCEVDSEHDVAAYENALKKGGWSHDWRQGASV